MKEDAYKFGSLGQFLDFLKSEFDDLIDFINGVKRGDALQIIVKSRSMMGNMENDMCYLFFKFYVENKGLDFVKNKLKELLPNFVADIDSMIDSDWKMLIEEAAYYREVGKSNFSERIKTAFRKIFHGVLRYRNLKCEPGGPSYVDEGKITGLELNEANVLKVTRRLSQL